MTNLKNTNWFEQCVSKLEVAQEMILELESEPEFSVHNQIKVNMILGLLKSPMEYSIGAIQKKYGKTKEMSYVPKKKPDQNNEDFKKYFYKKLGTDSDEVLKLLLSVQESEGIYWHSDLHEMNNNEKHSSINVHKKKIEKHAKNIQVGSVYIGSITVISDADKNPNPEILRVDDEIVDLSGTPGYYKKEDMYFEFNDKPVFKFLHEVLENVNEFVINTYVILEGKEPKLGS